MTTSFQKPAESKCFEIGGEKFAFAKADLSLRFLDQFANYVVVDEQKIDPRTNPLGIIDAVQITAVRGGPEEQKAAIVNLVTRHGAQPVPAVA